MSPAVQAPPADSVRAVLQRVYRASEYEWNPPRDLFGFLRRLAFGVLDWFGQLELTHPVAYWALLGVLMTMLVAIVVHFSYLIWRALRPAEVVDSRVRVAARHPRDAAWYLREARRLAEEARYSEALAYRFTALVLDLDGRSALKFHPSKTPSEYVAEARLDGAGRSRLAELVASLYRHLFGGEPCTADDVWYFDRRAGELRARIASA